MSGRSPPLYCTLILITLHSHQSYPNITTVIHSYEYSPTIVLFYLARLAITVTSDPFVFPSRRAGSKSSEHNFPCVLTQEQATLILRRNLADVRLGHPPGADGESPTTAPYLPNLAFDDDGGTGAAKAAACGAAGSPSSAKSVREGRNRQLVVGAQNAMINRCSSLSKAPLRSNLVGVVIPPFLPRDFTACCAMSALARSSRSGLSPVIAQRAEIVRLACP